MRSVNIAELKNHLSTYLDRVREGEEIIVRDRRKPIAKIVPLASDDWAAEEQALIASGLMRPAERSLTDAFWKLPLPRVSSARRAMAAIRWARGDR